MDLPREALTNLKASGLSDDSVRRMRCRSATVQDLPLSFPGYVIPYYVPRETGDYVALRPEEDGAAFNRVRLLPVVANGAGPQEPPQKYYQRSGSGSHLYFPPLVNPRDWFDIRKPLIITEGEKKAAAACQAGFLCLGIGGIDNWRSRKIRIDSDAIASGGGKSVVIELGDELEVKIEMKACPEFSWLPLEGREVYICFDTDPSAETRARVARAAFDFGIWLEAQGAHPKNILLPAVEVGEAHKGALDDFLQLHTPEDLRELMRRATFPTRPKMRTWIRKQLANPRRNRNIMTSVSRGVLAALDDGGTRYQDSTGMFYYFDKHTDILHTLPIETGQPIAVAAPTFHRMLVQRYGLSSADREVVQRLIDDFESLPRVEQIEKVHMQSYAAREAFYYQLSDSEMIRVNPTGLKVLRNGTDGVLFQSGATEIRLRNEPIPKDFGWLKTLQTTSLQPMLGMTMEETYAFVAGLFYLSPWLRRWKGLMLPVELAISEAGSGKSSLYQLRSAIFAGGTGQLQHQPDNMRDWYAMIAAARGMWVGDNYGMKVDSRLSNELARLITDPDPAFEMRELYTTSKLHRMPVDCTFAFTAIYNPFSKPDILQRSVQMQFKARSRTNREDSWLSSQLADGGRERWLMHHLRMIARFLREAQGITWGKSSGHRLVGFEQSLLVMGRVMGVGSLMESAVSKLGVAIQETIARQEPTIEAMRSFVEGKRLQLQHTRAKTAALPPTTEFELEEMCEWASMTPNGRFADIRILESPRILQRHMMAHASDIYEATGIKPSGKTVRGFPSYLIDFANNRFARGETLE